LEQEIKEAISCAENTNAMSHQIGRNDPCPCGSGKKYKKCCLRNIEHDHKESATWIDEEGMHLMGEGMRPSIEEQERMTKEYQQKIRKSPLWKEMVTQYGKEEAEKMLKEFQVEVR
jgi:hypothetical protein